MHPIEIFYHLYIPGDGRCSLWSYFLDGCMTQLAESRLLEISNVNLSITMPKHWTEVSGLSLTKHDDHTVRLSFEDKLREYVHLRYPFVHIVDICDITEPNTYEGKTLKLLQQRACQVDTYFLYLHSKGITNYSPVATTTNWKEVLDHFVIKEWTHHVRKLQDHDVSGVRDAISSDLVMSGNYWWSKSSHIRALADPLDTEAYYETVGPTYRYAFERWITSNQAILNYIVDTKTNHYMNYCFVEKLRLNLIRD